MSDNAWDSNAGSTAASRGDNAWDTGSREPTTVSQKPINFSSLPDLTRTLSDEQAPHIKPILQAILAQESGGNPKIRDSVDGAKGIGQIMPATFARFAKSGEAITNPEDNLRVAARYIKHLYDKAGGDPAKVAVGYFSGEGNIGKDSPYLRDHKDGNGKSTSSYMADVMGRYAAITESGGDHPGYAINPDRQAEKTDAPQVKAPAWGELTRNDAFQKLTPAERDLARVEYFNRYLASGIPSEQRSQAKAYFMEQSKGVDYKAPGMWERFKQMFSSADGGTSQPGDKKAAAYQSLAGQMPAEDRSPAMMVDPMTGMAMQGADTSKLDVRSKYGLMADKVVADEQQRLATPTKPPLPADFMASAEMKAGVRAQMDAMTPEQRIALAQRNDIVGKIARQRNIEYAELDKAATGLSQLRQKQIDPLGYSAKQGQQLARQNGWDVENTKTDYATDDTRTEARLSRMRGQGDTMANAPAYAQQAARLGTDGAMWNAKAVNPEGYNAEVEQELEQTRKRWQDNPLYNNMLSRGVVKGADGYIKGIAGVNLALSELAGDKEGSQYYRQFLTKQGWSDDAMGKAKNHGQELVENAISSISQQLPALLAGAVTGSEGLVLSSMFVQSFGQEYGEGRVKGQTPAQATTRAAQFAALEVIGEKFGLKEQLGSIKSLSQGDYNQAKKMLWQALKHEVPGEELTTTGQFLVDKQGNGVGLNTEAGFNDYLGQVTDTLAATLIQSGLMQAGYKGIHQAQKAMPQAGQKREAYQAEIQRAALAQLTGQAAIVRPADPYQAAVPEALRSVDERARQAFTQPAVADAAPDDLTKQQTKQEPVATESAAPHHDGALLLGNYLQSQQADYLQAAAARDYDKVAQIHQGMVEHLTPLIGGERAKQFADNLVYDGDFHSQTGQSSQEFTDAVSALNQVNQAKDEAAPSQTTSQRQEPVQHQTGLAVVEAPVNELSLSEDVPQFKSGANKQGVVEALTGKFDRTGVAPIQVWERDNGKKEVISGRHRFDLAQRSGEKTIPSQIHREADGFTADHAAALDAILNIRDGQGKVKDYVSFFKTGITEQQAEEQGLLGRATGRRAYTIAHGGSDELIAAHSADLVSDEGAYTIARVAPGNSRLQAVAIKGLQDGKSIKDSVNLMQAVQAMAGPQADNMDLFGFDDSAMRDAEAMAKVASRKQRELQERVTAVSNAAKNPKLAKAEGVDVKDPASVLKRVEELRQQKEAWDKWATNPELVAQIHAELGMSNATVQDSTVQNESEGEPYQDTDTVSMFDDAPTHTEKAPPAKSEKAIRLERLAKKYANVTADNLLDYLKQHPGEVNDLADLIFHKKNHLLNEFEAAAEAAGFEYRGKKWVKTAKLSANEQQASKVFERAYADNQTKQLAELVERPAALFDIENHNEQVAIGDYVRHSSGQVARVASAGKAKLGVVTAQGEVTQWESGQANKLTTGQYRRAVFNAEQQSKQAEQVKNERSEPDYDAMFEQALNEPMPDTTQSGTVKSTKTERQTPRPKKVSAEEKGKTERELKEAAKSAAVNSAKSLTAAVDGLVALFGGKGGGLGSGPFFNDETYAQAKPYFEAAVAHLKQASADIMDVMRMVVNMVREKGGDDAARRMKPYIIRFVKEYNENQEQLHESATRTDTESDRQDQQTTAQHDEGLVSNGSDRAGSSHSAPRRSSAGGEGGRRDHLTVSEPGTDVNGTQRGDRVLESTGEFRPDWHDSESSHARGSRDNSTEGFTASEQHPGQESVTDVEESHVKGDTSFEAKLARQAEVNTKTPQLASKKSIDETLPLLLEGQREDVLFAEQRLSKPDGYGVLFTNGTGTGKTYLSLGIIRRMVNAGKTEGLILVPNDEVKREWLMSAPNLGLQLHVLSDTQDRGRGVAITTYANAGQNAALIHRDVHFVLADEAHLLMSNEAAEVTLALNAVRAITKHPSSARSRAEMIEAEAVARLTALEAELTDLRGRPDSPRNQAKRVTIERETEPLRRQLEQQIKRQRAILLEQKPEDRPRLIAMSATPFAYQQNVQWAHGYLFDYPEVSDSGYNAPSPYQAYMIQHFGYRMRYGKLNRPGPEVDTGLMQVQYNEHLRKQGVLSTRLLDVDKDYDRRFVLVNSGIGEKIDAAFTWLRTYEGGKYAPFYKAARERFDYLNKARLLESIKAQEAIAIIKDHHALGRKVVVFHDFNQGKPVSPFDFSGPLDDVIKVALPGRDRIEVSYTRQEFLADFNKQFPMFETGLSDVFAPAIEILKEAFPNALFNNGLVKKKDALAAIGQFNDDNQPAANLLVVQSSKNAGWSGHDTTGKFQRVAINLGLPVAPVKAIQQEGRIYRQGQKSDAIFRYLNTGTQFEAMAFASKIAERAGTAENLAMGAMARALKQSFISSFEETDYYPASAEDGQGGKAQDRARVNLSPFAQAKSFYYGQQKKTSKNKAREGVDYFATPEPVGLKMVEWLYPEDNKDYLEPSAGHGAIARWLPELANVKAIEPSAELSTRLAMVVNPKGIITDQFEQHHISNKYDGIVMNPPFGAGGKLAMEHLAKAFEHLRDGGRVVAIIPDGEMMRKRLGEWLYGTVVNKQGDTVSANPHAQLVADFVMPAVTFERAGTHVMTRIVVIDRNMSQKTPDQSAIARYDLRQADTINELFDQIEHLTVPPRRNTGSDSAKGESVDVIAGKPVLVEAMPKELATALAEAVAKPGPEFEVVGDKLKTNAPLVTVTTQSGKVLSGVYVPDRAMAKQIDPFTWKPKGQAGYFVREKHLVRVDEAYSIDTAIKQRQAGTLSQADFLAQAKDYARGIETPPDTEVRAGILMAAKAGYVEQKTTDMMLWLLDKNPALLSNLKLHISHDSGGKYSGVYNSAERLIKIAAGMANETTGMHEVLHHAERMLPDDVRKGIRTAWEVALGKAMLKSKNDPARWRAFRDIVRANASDINDISGRHHSDNLGYWNDGTLTYDDYPLLNPSEFFAVHGADILAQRYKVEQQGWVAKAKAWLRDLAVYLQGVFGKKNHLVTAINAALKADGRFVTEKMLHQLKNVRGKNTDETFDLKNPGEVREALRPYAALKAMRDGYSPYVGIEVEKLQSTPIGDSLRKIFAPASRGSAAKETAGIMRHRLAQQAREREVALERLKEFAALFDRLPVEDSYAFIDNMERGHDQGDAKLNEAAKAMRELLDQRRDEVIALGKGQLEHYNSNYFPHIWKERQRASAFFSRKTLEGGKHFLKARKYDYFADGLAAGLSPITTNPVELTLLKAREMDRYIYGQRIFAEMKLAGLVRYVGVNQEAPEGWEKVNDKIAKVAALNRAAGGIVHFGDFYAPEQAATLINNYLSPGLTGIGLFDAWRSVGNMLNGVQLGLSAFHLGFTTLDAMISRVSLGVKQVSHGHIGGGLANIAIGVTPVQPIINLMKGDKLLKAYLGELNDPGLTPIVEALMQAGGRVKMDDFYRNTTVNGFKQALRAGRYGEASLKILPRALDIINKPIFEYLVPRQKLGVFFDMAKDYLARHPDATLLEKRAALGKLWDSVDNRLGELVYDNLFWKKTLKHGLMASVRSVGWNLGTWREIGGGVIDLANIRTEKGLTDRSAYLIALPFVTALFGAIIQYLYTGEPPDELKDVFFPRNGKFRNDGSPDRVSMPSYMKDIYEYGHDVVNFGQYGGDPLKTVKNKMHPMISTVGQMLSNEDFFGAKIRSPGDPWVQQVKDEAEFLMKQFTPFGVRNYMQQSRDADKEATALGYLASPQFYGLGSAAGHITKTDEELETQQVTIQSPGLQRKFREALKNADTMEEKAAIVERMVRAGLTPEQIQQVIATATPEKRPLKPKQFIRE